MKLRVPTRTTISNPRETIAAHQTRRHGSLEGQAIRSCQPTILMRPVATVSLNRPTDDQASAPNGTSSPSQRGPIDRTRPEGDDRHSSLRAQIRTSNPRRSSDALLPRTMTITVSPTNSGFGKKNSDGALADLNGRPVSNLKTIIDGGHHSLCRPVCRVRWPARMPASC
jgi:hypothetical protein